MMNVKIRDGRGSSIRKKKIKRRDVPTRTKSRNLRSSSRFIDEAGVLSQALTAKLSPSIVWLSSYHGKRPYSKCTGIVVLNDQVGASFVTSGNLVRYGDLVTSGYAPGGTSGDTSGDLDTVEGYIGTVEIKVHLPNGKVVNAYVQDYIVACNMLVVATESFPDLRPACLDTQMQVERSTKLLAASLDLSGKFGVTTGVRTSSPTGVERDEIMWSTCQITEIGSGGPLFDFDGNIVGMNLYKEAGATAFVPTKWIVKCMIDLGFWVYVNNVPTPFNLSSEGTSSPDVIISSSSPDAIISSSSSNVSSEGSESKNQEPSAFPNHRANGVWCDLSGELASNLSPRIISLASFDGEALHSECTGMVIDRKLSSASFLTTGSLFGSLHEDFWYDLKIMVRLPNNEEVQAWLQYYSGPFSLAVVITHSLPPSPDLDLGLVRLDSDMQVESSAELLAVRRCFFSGKLMSTRGSLTGAIHHSEGYKLSTCKIIEGASGGPLVDCDGNIVGINYYDGEQTLFLPSNLILKYLGRDVNWLASKQDCCWTNKSSTPHSDGPKERSDDELRLILAPWQPDGFKRRVNEILHAFGYPLPSFVDDGMYLKWDFEEGFGADIWNEPTRRVTSKMSRSVVALASFLPVDGSAGARKFACTGVFIESHESTTRILTSASLVRSPGDENFHPEWKIEVCLPSKRREKGKLEYCNLQHNVAVVSIKSVHSYRAAKLDETSQTEVGAQVVALGRGFESGKLMATNGAVIGKCTSFDHEELQISTCKITKAGIGGPLVDFDGNFVGMNFYDREQTPYLPRARILELIGELNAERTVPVETPVETPDKSSSWPVPDPEWFYPTRYPAKPRPVECVLE